MLAVYFAFGLIVGSFLNVLIYRIPHGEGFFAGRSHCPYCGHRLVWYDLVPLVSFVLLRGHCRYCSERISLQYPLIELISGLLFVLLWQQPLMLAAIALLLVISVIDLQHFLIPDMLLVPIVLLALVNHRSWDAVIFAFAAALFFFLLWFFSRGRWIGFGDVKLAGVLGLLFGFPDALVVFYVAVIVGGLLGSILLVLKKATMKTQLPFGTLLAFGAVLVASLQAPIHEILSRF
ncbi:MAG: prepilin peptidase [Patescibacteria group bacterium]